MKVLKFSVENTASLQQLTSKQQLSERELSDQSQGLKQLVIAILFRSSEASLMASSSSGQKERRKNKLDTSKEQVNAAPQGNPQPETIKA